jgi:hypothetical protein
MLFGSKVVGFVGLCVIATAGAIRRVRRFGHRECVLV